MIAAQPVAAQPPRWQTLWRQSIRDPVQLLTLLGLDAGAFRLAAPDPNFPLRVPRGFVARMRPGDPHDPLLRQVLPLADEDVRVPGFSLDAVGDLAAQTSTGVLHKYHGRALLISTGSCAVHCRYCFRRHFPYAQGQAGYDRFAAATARIAADLTIEEVLLSGGDPLALATERLAELSARLTPIAHLRRLRIHTRLPIVLPERVDAALCAWLRTLPWPVAIVLHSNHPNELDENVGAACARLRATGAVLLNQSVLLRGVNDRAETLAALSTRLFDLGVLPYYLHQLDRVHGAAHFEVDDVTALALHARLQRCLPGYLLPRLVREVAGAHGKLDLREASLP